MKNKKQVNKLFNQEYFYIALVVILSLFLIKFSNLNLKSILTNKDVFYNGYKVDSIYSCKGEIVHKQFVPELQSNGSSSFGMTSSGSMVYVPSNGPGKRNEMYLVFFKSNENTTYKIDDINFWGNLNKGDSVLAYFRYKNKMNPKLEFTSFEVLRN